MTRCALGSINGSRNNCQKEVPWIFCHALVGSRYCHGRACWDRWVSGAKVPVEEPQGRESGSHGVWMHLKSGIRKDLEWQKFKRTFTRTLWNNLRASHTWKCGGSRQEGPESSPELRHEHCHGSAAEKRGLWEGVAQEPLRRALFCVFLCSEVIFSCKSHRNFFQKLPLPCRHFLENPLAKTPKRSCWTGISLPYFLRPDKGLILSSFRATTAVNLTCHGQLEFHQLLDAQQPLWPCGSNHWRGCTNTSMHMYPHMHPTPPPNPPPCLIREK